MQRPWKCLRKCSYLAYISLPRCSVAHSCPTLCDPRDCSQRCFSVHGDCRQEYRSGLPCPLSGIFPTQGSNPGLPHCRWILYRLSHRKAIIMVCMMRAWGVQVPSLLTATHLEFWAWWVIFESGVWLACTCHPPLVPPRYLRKCLAQADFQK